MGFFSKVWKSITFGIRKIGKGIKSAVKHVGKFMDKIGIVGQIALMFVLPMAAPFLAQGIAGLQAMGGFAAGVGNVLATVGKFASTVGNAFRSVTDAIFGFVKNLGTGFINQAASALGKEGLLIEGGPATISQGFGKWMQGVNDSVRNIASPFRTASEAASNTVATSFEKTFADPIDSLEDTLGQSPIDRGPTFKSVFEDPLKIPDVEVLTNDQPFGVDLTGKTIKELSDAESSGLKGFLSDVSQFAIDTVKDIPENIIDATASGVTSGVVDSALDAVGLGTEQPDFITNISNVPQFKSAPIIDLYNQQGINYGALPDNRLAYFASQNAPQGDFGFSGFAQFAKLRTA